jgi:hypothetical protein
MERVLDDINFYNGAKIYLNSLEVDSTSGFIFEIENDVKRRYFIDNIKTNNKAKIKECVNFSNLEPPPFNFFS